MLLYTAELKRPLREPLASKKEAVERLISRLALDKCRWGRRAAMFPWVTAHRLHRPDRPCFQRHPAPLGIPAAEIRSPPPYAPRRDVRIGSPLKRGISGGQAKRTNVGIALITMPSVLFLVGVT